MPFPSNPTDGQKYTIGGREYTYDSSLLMWVKTPLGGTGGGLPIGSIISFASATPPQDFLLCAGAAYDPVAYPELFGILGQVNLPDLRGQFIMGANNQAEIDGFTKHQDTTRLPRKPFTGTTNQAGNHHHAIKKGRAGNFWDAPGQQYNVSMDNASGAGYMLVADDGQYIVQANGNHQHNLNINGGGDSATRPNHVILSYIIKAK